MPDCGTTFTWGTKAFGPWVGWMGGWGVAVAGMVVLANLAQIAGIYFWSLWGDGTLAENVPLVPATGVVFIAVMTWVSWRGVQIGERIQNILLSAPYVALAIFVIAALWSFFAGTAPDTTPVQWSWFNPFAFTSWSGLTQAILLALFITYVGVTVAAMMYAGLGTSGSGLGNEDNADDFFLAIKDGLLGPFGWVLVVAVLISAVSSTQTTILPTARGTLAMAAYRALPERFTNVHPRYKTPSFSTVVRGIVAVIYDVAVIYYVAMTLISDNILQDSILSLGLAIAFYYAITGYACVWYFRRELRGSARNFLYRGLLPLLGAVMLTYAFVQSAIDMYDVEYGYSSPSRAPRRSLAARLPSALERRANRPDDRFAAVHRQCQLCAGLGDVRRR